MKQTKLQFMSIYTCYWTWTYTKWPALVDLCLPSASSLTLLWLLCSRP